VHLQGQVISIKGKLGWNGVAKAAWIKKSGARKGGDSNVATKDLEGHYPVKDLVPRKGGWPKGNWGRTSVSGSPKSTKSGG